MRWILLRFATILCCLTAAAILSACDASSREIKEVNGVRAEFPSEAGMVISQGEAYLGAVYFLTENGLYKRKSGGERAKFEMVCSVRGATKLLTSTTAPRSAAILADDGRIWLHEMGGEGCGPLTLVQARVFDAQFDDGGRLYLATEQGLHLVDLRSEMPNSRPLWNPFEGTVSTFAVSDDWLVASGNQVVLLRELHMNDGMPSIGEREFRHDLEKGETVVEFFFHSQMILAVIETSERTPVHRTLRQFIVRAPSGDLESRNHRFDSLPSLVEPAQVSRISKLPKDEGYLFASTTRGLYRLMTGPDGKSLISIRVKQPPAGPKESWIEVLETENGQKLRRAWFVTGQGVWISQLGGWPPTPETEENQDVYQVKVRIDLQGPALDEDYARGGGFLEHSHYVVTAEGELFVFEDAASSPSIYVRTMELVVKFWPILPVAVLLVLFLLAVVFDWPIRILCNTPVRDKLRLLHWKWSRHKALSKLTLGGPGEPEIWWADLGVRDEELALSSKAQFLQEVADAAGLDRDTVQEASMKVEFRVKLTIRESARQYKLPRGGEEVQPLPSEEHCDLS